MAEKLKDKIAYTVIELPWICQVAKSLFPEDRYINFTESIPTDTVVDIIYLNSSLQYIEDSKNLIKQLATCAPSFFIFERASIGDNIEFFTCQINIKNKKIPYQFLNRKSFIGELHSLGYELIFERDDDCRLTMDNFPETHRLPCTRSYVFRRMARRGS